MDQPTQPESPRAQAADFIAIEAEGGDLERIAAVLSAAGFCCARDGALLRVDAGASQGVSPLGALLGAVESLADDVQTLVELEAVERLASIGRFLVEPSGALRLSEEAARLLADAISVDEVCAQAAEEARPALRRWLLDNEELRSEVIELNLTASDGRSRRLRFVDAGDTRRRRGFVQATAFLPARPAVGEDLAPPEPTESLERRLEAAVASARRHDRSMAILAVRLGSERPPADEVERRALRAAIQLRFDRALRVGDVNGPAIELGAAEGELDLFMIAAELDTPAEALAVARRLTDCAREPLALDSGPVRVELGVGVALLGTDGDDVRALARSAREAALAAECEDGVVFASPKIHAQVGARLELECDLAEAIRQGHIIPYYQPKVDAATERAVGVEALARWRHPERGLVSPAEFIPPAEENGMILPIGEAILRRACEDAVEWQRQGIPPLRVAVNLSAAQFAQPDLVEMVVRTLDETGLDPSLLELELTESMLMDDAEAAVTILRRFERHGISLAIDDFGTGYSSLSYLRRLPIDALKIDRSFIDDVNVNPDDAAIATSIILLGRSLKLRVVAEGVETRKQLEFLRVMQCDEIQGYLYSPPAAPEKIVELLRSLMPGV
ncbi:MAG: GGDEF domain-containing phosphodiesterase [Planctomycetota bacterium]